MGILLTFGVYFFGGPPETHLSPLRGGWLRRPCSEGDDKGHCVLLVLHRCRDREEFLMGIVNTGGVNGHDSKKNDLLEVPTIYWWPMFLGYGFGDPANMAKNMVQSVPPFWDPVISNEQVATGLLSGNLTWHYIAMDKHHF